MSSRTKLGDQHFAADGMTGDAGGAVRTVVPKK